jgi:hypothetical protein
MKATIWLWLLLPVIATQAGELKKTAVLFLPDQIERESGGGAAMQAEIGFRWDEKEPLQLGLFRDLKNSGKYRVLGGITVFDEKDHELDKAIFMTLPPFPDTEITITKGEVKRFELEELYSTVLFPRPGNYYAVASIHYGISGGKTVSFTTNKRWFRVVEAPDKKSGL